MDLLLPSSKSLHPIRTQGLQDAGLRAVGEGSRLTHRRQGQPPLHLYLSDLPLTYSLPLQQLHHLQGKTLFHVYFIINSTPHRERTPTPVQPRDLSQRAVSPDPQSSDEKEAVRTQLLQVGADQLQMT